MTFKAAFYAMLMTKKIFLRSFSWSCQELSPVNIFQLDVPFGVEGMLLKVHVLKIGVHVETRGSEMVGTRDVWNNTFAAFANLVQPHPHIPVPHLKSTTELIILQVLLSFSLNGS